MIYNVKLFTAKGSLIREMTVEESTFRSAAEFVGEYEYPAWNHLTVVNKNMMVKRYDRKFKIIKAPATMFKQTHTGHPAILIMTGRFAEFYGFKTKEERDEVFSQCLTSIPAESASPDKEPKDTTVYSDVIYVSGSGSMSKKTLNGSAQRATWMARLTRFNIDKGFGKSKSVVSEKGTWT